MNRIILTILLLSSPLLLQGQMFPLSDDYLFNGLVINPAFAGCHDALSATVSYRDQWVGFDDAPKIQILSIHTPVDHDRMGLGLLINHNSIGIFDETNIIGNYAYRMELSDGKLAMGLGFGFTVFNAAWNELKANDMTDPQLMGNQVKTVLPEFSLGLYYYTKKYFIGFSMPMFLTHYLDKNSGKYKTNFNFSGSGYFLSGGYTVLLNPQVKLLPSVLIKYHVGNAVQIDYNTQVILKDRIWLGMGYRNTNTLTGMIQCQLNYQIRMAYSYDFDMGTLGKYRNGSHEVVLNYIFKFARKVAGPRQF